MPKVANKYQTFLSGYFYADNWKKRGSMPILTKKLLTFLSTDPSPNEMAKYLTLTGMVEPSPKAATISALDDDGTIYEIARFGLSGEDPFLDKNSIWKKLQPFDAVRAGELQLLDASLIAQQIETLGGKLSMDPWLKTVLVIPINKKDVPVGAIGLFFEEHLDSTPELNIDYESLQALFVMAYRTPQFALAISKNSKGELPPMTDQEYLFLQLIARGFSNKQIAARTQLALPTVKAKVSKLLRAFDVKGRKELLEKTKHIEFPRLD